MTLDIEAKGLELRYGAVTALDDLRFHLTGGRIYGLLGRNGSGKTSLLSVLAGFRKASGGTVLVDGQPVFENPRVTRLLGNAVITGDGREIEPRRSMSRALIAWAPAIAWFVYLAASPKVQGFVPTPPNPLLGLAVTLGALAVGAALTIARPSRGPHDWLLGTWVVPR